MLKERTNHRILTAAALALAVLFSFAFVAGCGSDGDTADESSGTTTANSTAATEPNADGGAKTVKVDIKDFAFDPDDLKIAKGTTVTWTNEDSAPHTATSTDGPASFDSGTLKQGKTYSHEFTKPGTYSYYCSIHNYMTATVTVS